MDTAPSQSFFPPELPAAGKPRRSDARFHIVLLLFTLEAAYLLRHFGPISLRPFVQTPPLDSFLAIILLFAAVLTSVLLHEGGHLIAALTSGFKVLGASLGPWRLHMLHGKRKFTYSPHRWFDASLSASPSQLEGWRPAMMTVVAAGPLVTFTTALISFSALDTLAPSSSSLILFVTFLAQVNALLFLLGLIPNSPSARALNDIRLFLMLAANGPAAEQLELNVQLTLLVIKGVRPQDYPSDLMRRLVQWRGRPEVQLIFANALVRWAIDCDERVLAESWDWRALELSEQCDFRMRNQALASSACIDILFRDDFESARNKFTQVKTELLFPKCFEYRARAARHIALGRNSKAATEILRAQYALPRGVVAYELERKLLENLHFRILTSSQTVQAKAHAACAV